MVTLVQFQISQRNIQNLTASTTFRISFNLNLNDSYPLNACMHPCDVQIYKMLSYRRETALQHAL